MSRWRIGVIDEPWIDLEPPISQTNPERATTDKTESLPSAGQKVKKTSSEDKNTQTHATGSWQEGSTTPAAEWLELRSTVAKQLKKEGDTHTYSEALDHLHQLELDLDLGEYPAVDAQTQRAISTDFQELHRTIREQGLYKCRLSNYAKEMVRYSSLFCLFVVAFRCDWILLSAVFLGLFWHQIMFSAHDAGHLSITHNFKVDTAIGIFIADFCCGLSMGWWKSSHNVHHLVPNHPVSLSLLLDQRVN